MGFNLQQEYIRKRRGKSVQLSTVAAVTAEALSCTKMKLSDLPKCETLMKKFYTHMLASATSAHRRVYWFHSYRLFPPPFFYVFLFIIVLNTKPQPLWVKSLWFRPVVRVSVQQDDGNVHNRANWDGDITNVCLLHTETQGPTEDI